MRIADSNTSGSKMTLRLQGGSALEIRRSTVGANTNLRIRQRAGAARRRQPLRRHRGRDRGHRRRVAEPVRARQPRARDQRPRQRGVAGRLQRRGAGWPARLCPAAPSRCCGRRSAAALPRRASRSAMAVTSRSSPARSTGPPSTWAHGDTRLDHHRRQRLLDPVYPVRVPDRHEPPARCTATDNVPEITCP